jgi:crossover junction endodeoxyribonuclease RuvC
LNITGYAVVQFGKAEPAIIEAGTIRTTGSEMASRIEQIHADLANVIRDLKPDAAAVEQIYAHYKHPRTAILMAHARGIVMLACQQAGMAVHNLAATHVKKSITGNGHASKLQMQRSIQSICRLSKLPEPPDVADAMAMALCAGGQLMRGSITALSTDDTDCADVRRGE